MERGVQRKKERKKERVKEKSINKEEKYNVIDKYRGEEHEKIKRVRKKIIHVDDEEEKHKGRKKNGESK